MAPHQSRVSCGPERVWAADRDSGSRSCGHCRSPQTLIWCPEEGEGREGGKEGGGGGGTEIHVHVYMHTCMLGH